MTKKNKIILIFFIFAFFLVLYLVVTSEKTDKNKQYAGQKIQKVDLGKLESDYKAEAKSILDGYSQLSNNNGIDINEVKQVKNNFLALKVPTKFKDLHLDLVLAMVKMENFLTSGANEEKIASQQIVSRIKANYAWIN